VRALAGRVVTIDAMGCQTAIARTIHAKGGDYVLSWKDNQPRRHDDSVTFFADAQARDFRNLPHTTAATVDGNHSRIEVRRAWDTDALAWLPARRRWAGLRSVLRVDSERTIGTHTTRESRFFISSLAPDAAHLALNLLKQERTEKLGITNKRLAAGWDHDFLLRVIMGAKNQDAIALGVGFRPNRNRPSGGASNPAAAHRAARS